MFTKPYLTQAISFLALPFMLFCFGFLRWYFSVPIVTVMLYCASKVWRSQPDIVTWLTFKQKLLLLLVALLWCAHSGIGGLWVQHYDFAIKNAVLRDLIHRSWPLYYDLSVQVDSVQQLIGSDKVAFTYYLFTYLPAAFCGWITESEMVGQMALLLWSTWGVYLVLSFIVSFVYSRQVSTKVIVGILLAIFCFSGLEVLGSPLLDMCLGEDILHTWWSRIQSLSIAKEMWCWPYFSMYGSLYSDMEIRFNQTIPIWIVMSLMLSYQKRESVGFFFSFLILYSPWACIGVGGMIVYLVIRDFVTIGWKSVTKYITIESILFPSMLGLVVGSYYLSNQNSASFSGWFWQYMAVDEFLIRYLLFILIEIGCYFFILKKNLASHPWLQASFVLLLLLPFYRITAANDLLMCASIPAIFVIAVYWFDWLKTHFIPNTKKTLWIVLLVAMTALTPLEWLIAEDYHFLKGETPKTRDMVYSFAQLKEENAQLCDQQFFSHQYEQSFFWRHLAK